MLSSLLKTVLWRPLEIQDKVQTSQQIYKALHDLSNPLFSSSNSILQKIELFTVPQIDLALTSDFLLFSLPGIFFTHCWPSPPRINFLREVFPPLPRLAYMPHNTLY